MDTQEALKAIEDKIAEKTAGLVSAEELTGLKNDLAAVKEIAEKANNSEDAETFKKSIADLETQMAALKEKKEEEAPAAKSLGEAIYNAYKAAKDDIVGLLKQKSGQVSLNVKAAGTMTITNNYTGGVVALSDLEPGVARVQRRRPFMRQLVNSRGTTSKYVTWIEQKNPDPGTAGMVAEGADKPQTDFDLVEANERVKKIAAFIKVSMEMVADLPFMQGEINGELMELIELKLDEQILSGDGTGENLVGILTNAQTFTGAGFLASVPQANESDVLRIALTQVANNNFDANYILLNPQDAAKLELTKDANGQYTYLVTVTMDGVSRVKGVPVIENNGVTAGDFLVGDFTKSNLRVREEMEISVGYVNDDFTKNLMTVLAEMRGAHYVKSNHYGAFVKGTFATAIGLINQP